jgi:hypothetical protein
LTNIQDSLDLMGNADYLGAKSAVIYNNNNIPDFFKIKTKLVGKFLQKYVNYNFKLAIVGGFDKYKL